MKIFTRVMFSVFLFILPFVSEARSPASSIKELKTAVCIKNAKIPDGIICQIGTVFFHKDNIFWLIIVCCLASLFLLFLIKQIHEREKENKLLEESRQLILEQKKEIEAQKKLAAFRKKEISDGIYYAQRIQKAILPSVSILEDILPDHFIMSQPRDTVSGDFYWIAENEGILIIAAVDCTGHGVKGALLSMLGVAFLNSIINKITFNKHIRSLQANDVLNKLREQLILALHPSGKPDQPKEGMDMSLCIFDIENRQMQFAGAHNSALVIRNGTSITLEADKMSVGSYMETGPSFTNRQIQLQSNDVIYIFSDGYYDQFGGPKGRKLMSPNFRKYLVEIYQKSMTQQKKLLEDFYNRWKGNNEQVDDVLVIGLRFTPQINSSKVSSVLLWHEKHFLIAEDTEINYILLVEALKSTKVKITRVTNGFEAVEFCRGNKVDLILMDINMPVMDGIEATRLIRTFNEELPIIAHTALARDDDMIDIMSAGCNDYIAKPIDLKSFLAVISKNLIK
jgi:CheY-like chemotaxis protein/serine phosphatase RsbU (regulator of sigma subunit)